MSKFWRVIAPVVAAGGLIAAGAIPAASASSTSSPTSPATASPSPTPTSTYSITIAAQSPFPKISGDTLVIYKTTGYKTATISGTVTGAAASGDVATLWSKPFGAKKFALTSSSAPVTTGAPSYSFPVTPGQATAYEVQVTTGPTVDVTSTAVTVYVTEGINLTGAHKKCSRTTCTFSYHVWELLPAAAYKTETHKKFYLYLAVGYPNLPGRFTLDKGAKASKIKKIHSGEFEVTFTWYITLHRGTTEWNTAFCTKDTESKDGMGLPGHHGCGNKHISTKAIYIG